MICIIKFIFNLIVKLTIKFNLYNFLDNTTRFIRKFIKPLNIYKLNSTETVLIINGGGFIFDDFFDWFIAKKIINKFPNANIITLDYLRNEPFDNIVLDASNKINKMQLVKPIHLYAHSAGCALGIALSNYIFFKSITFVSPFFSFGKVKDISNNNDILKPNTINYISKKYKIDINKYVSNAKLPINTKIIFGSKEVMKPNILLFSKIMGIQTVISLKNKIHGLPLWYFQDSKILSSLFRLN
jgi:hypothetical protein